MTKAKSVVKPFQSRNHENVGDLYTNTIVIKFVVERIHVNIDNVEITIFSKILQLTLQELENVLLSNAQVKRQILYDDGFGLGQFLLIDFRTLSLLLLVEVVFNLGLSLGHPLEAVPKYLTLMLIEYLSSLLEVRMDFFGLLLLFSRR